jgi:hypothetical protein
MLSLSTLDVALGPQIGIMTPIESCGMAKEPLIMRNKVNASLGAFNFTLFVACSTIFLYANLVTVRK